MRLLLLSYLITSIISTASAVVVNDAAAANTNDNVDTTKQARSLRGDIRKDNFDAINIANNNTNNNGGNGPGNNGPRKYSI